MRIWHTITWCSCQPEYCINRGACGAIRWWELFTSICKANTNLISWWQWKYRISVQPPSPVTSNIKADTNRPFLLLTINLNIWSLWNAVFSFSLNSSKTFSWRICLTSSHQKTQFLLQNLAVFPKLQFWVIAFLTSWFQYFCAYRSDGNLKWKLQKCEGLTEWKSVFLFCFKIIISNCFLSMTESCENYVLVNCMFLKCAKRCESCNAGGNIFGNILKYQKLSWN